MTQFKVGDKVRVVQGHGSMLPTGNTYMVKRVSKDFLYVGTEDDGWDRDRFELVTESKFAVGTRVRVLPAVIPGGKRFIGKVGTIYAPSGSFDWNVKFDDDTRYSFLERELEVVTHKFKPGDRVISMYPAEGAPHKATVVRKIGSYWMITLDERGGTWTASAEELTLMPKPKPVFKWGDRVRITGAWTFRGKKGVVLAARANGFCDVIVPASVDPAYTWTIPASELKHLTPKEK